ncbi:FAD-dependent monooxygenase [Nocardia sp. NPDC051570]|uniref:FAD-dependent monooxygenase n=1 Tax=Nocardia sp. NPDC051570 TaxID=3364324 RepID=UPI0037AA32BA
MTETFDVVVAGAGPVGLMLACELRLAGVDVLVVERLREPDQTLKAGGINVSAAEAFYRRGLLPEVERHSSLRVAQVADSLKAAVDPAGLGKKKGPVGHFAGIFVDGELIERGPDSADRGPVDHAIFITQQDIESILAARAAELDVRVRRGTELTGFTDDSDCVTIWLGDTVIRAGWLVGCDGGRSIVRKLAGFEFPGVEPLITGHQAVVEMSGAENLPGGWHTTDIGIYAHGPTPGRILTVELDGPPADRDAPITAAELQASLRNVSGVPVEITAVRSATRFTDNTRQATDYRRGRVLLAGDSAHVHSPFGGQGLNLGIGDAMNLGWKLAAVVAGRAPAGLLDSYTAERHPIGAWVLEWTRAQVAIMRTDAHSRAMRRVTEQLLATRDGANMVHQKLGGMLHRYDLGDGHPLTGASAPDIELSDGTRLGEHLVDGRAVLVDLADSAALRECAEPWSDRVRTLTAKSFQPRDLSALLLRPDAIVAWAADTGETAGLGDALRRWFGDPA